MLPARVHAGTSEFMQEHLLQLGLVKGTSAGHDTAGTTTHWGEQGISCIDVHFWIYKPSVYRVVAVTVEA